MPDTFSVPNFAALGTPPAPAGEGAILRLFGPWRPKSRIAVPVAERVRFALMRSCPGRVPWQLSGKDEAERPRIGHDHLFFLPLCRDGGSPDSSIEQVLLWANKGLEEETRALLLHFANKGGWLRIGPRPKLRLELVAVGAPPTLTDSLASPTLGEARVWRSATPFVAPRHCKRRRGQLVDTPKQQLIDLAERNLGVRPVKVERLEGELGWASFCQQRGRGRPDAAGWILHFSEPVAGPIVLGSGAHYGLGRFEAVDP